MNVPVEKRVPIPIERHVPISVEKPLKYTEKKYLPIPDDKDDYHGSNSENSEQRVEGTSELSAGYSAKQPNETDKKTKQNAPPN